MQSVKHSSLPRRLGAFVLALALLLGVLPALGLPSPETEVHAATGEAAMDQLVSWGVIGGYPDGSLGSERVLTRAEFAAMVNRAYGYTEPGATPFIDVPATAWYANDIAIGYNAGYFTGVSPRMAQPNQSLTREQALVMIGRNMRLEPVGGEVVEFADGRSFSTWSAAYARAAAQDGLIGGYADGTFRPQNEITRGEMALMLQRSLGTLINNPGTHTLNDVYGNVTVSSPGAVLKDSTVAGNLYLTGGLGLGDITLENVRVLGDIVVAGGGESQSGESVILRNVEADSLKIDSMSGQYVSLAAEGNTVIPDTVLKTDTYIQDRTRPGEGLQTITLDSDMPQAQFNLSGNLETIVNKSPTSNVNVAMGTVYNYKADEEGAGSTLNLDVNSTVKTLNLDTATPVTGVGSVDKLYVDAAGSTVEMLPDNITIRPGLTANVGGEDMNAAQAIESSSDPRLLAGYPKLRNVASKTATAVFEANKAGKVYWAVSATVDGSIGEEELVSPTSGNTRIVLSGNLAITEANKEFTANLTKLTPDSGYYLSCVMVDARGRYSPVKVVSFHTPDDTVPNFTSGYPKVLQNDYTTVMENGRIKRDEEGHPVRDYHVQFASMSNKTCQLYYALYPQGSSAPTAAQFRSGAVGQPIRSGVADAIKNVINFVDFSGLAEQTTYDAYFCLIDADGSLSSAVKKMTFTTQDGTPPVFQYDTPLVTKETATGLTLAVNVSENATVYWAVSRDKNYIKDSADWDEIEWWEHACRQIESGTNAIRGGSTSVRADNDSNLNISGLAAATEYTIYFVAKDTAGNYSEFTVANVAPFHYNLTANTLDNMAPEVRQEFTHLDETDPTKPYADTDIKLIFNETVMQYSTNRSLTREAFNTFDSLYAAVKAATTAEERTDAKAAFGAALRSTITLYNTASISLAGVPDRAILDDDGWVIDFREVQLDVDRDTGEMTLYFPSGENGAINLSSGATYYFVLDDIADTSSAINRMPRTTLERFTTISAQTSLNEINVSKIKWGGKTIPIDMAFSMTPRTTNVESSIDWDMIFWSDTSVSFEVYELDSGANNTSGHPVKKVQDGEEVVGDPSNIEIINDKAVTNADINADDYQGYLGRSLFRNFYGLDFNPSVTGEGNVISTTNASLKKSGIMEAKKTKFYGIHFTSVNHSAENDRTRPDGDPSHSWEATVNMRISVLTGTSVNLGNLSSNINKATLQNHEDNWGVVQIHSPRPFRLQKGFSDSTAPGFAEGFPRLSNTDTEAELNVLLDRPGTLYYAVMPVRVETSATGKTTYTPPIKTLLAGNVAIDETTIAQIPAFGTNVPAKLSMPSPDQIYTLNFNDTTIKSGQLTMESTSQVVNLEDLMADTLYFVYFVTQGKGQVYSEQVMLYQFKTEEVNRPKLYLTNSGSSTVQMQSKNMNADADYVMVMMSAEVKELTDPFNKHVSDIRIANDPNKALHMANSYTVMDALTDLDPNGGSVFDDYASLEHKETLRKIVIGQLYREGVLIPSYSETLAIGRNVAVDCQVKYADKIQVNQNYFFIAVARSTAADDSVGIDSYGFAGYQPVLILDVDPPTVVDISGSITVDYNCIPGQYVFRGTINLSFDKDLYLYESANERYRIDPSNHNVANFQQVGMDDGSIRTKSILHSSTGDTVTLEVSYQDDNGDWHYAQEGDYFLANRNLTSYYSSPTLPMRITLNYLREEGKVTATFAPADPWYLPEVYTFNARVEINTAYVDRITLDPSAAKIPVNGERTIDATALPTTALDRSIGRWEIEDETVAKIMDSGKNTDTTGKTTGGYAKVKGLKQGDTVLRCYNADGSISAECKITVENVLINNIIIADTSGEIASTQKGARDEPVNLNCLVTATLEPADATALLDLNTTTEAIIVTPTDPKVAKVDRIVRTGSSNIYQIWIVMASPTATGSTMIYVQSRDGGATTAFTVTIP